MNSRKKKNQIRHCKRRFQERLRIELTQDARDRIIHAIRTNSTIRGRRQNNRLSKHWLEFEGREIVVIYDKVRRVIVTVMEPVEGEIK